MNLVYQEVLKEKLAELEQLLNENQQQQKEIEAQISGPSASSSSLPGIPPQKQFLGYFMKPYFKDKLTGLGPPANEETKARLSHGTRPIDELKIKRWDGWQKTLLTNAVAKDTMKRMLQPKLSKLDYLSAKMSRAADEGKEELKKQIDLIEKEIVEISALKDDQLLGNRHDDHDWEKISNIDFEALRQAEDLNRFWQNYLHPSIDKSVWKRDEIVKLKGIVEEYNCCHWDKIAEALGTYQRYISKTFRRKEWTKVEDEILRKLVEKMRIGNFIPYIQMSYFMEGRDGSQLAYRWTSVLDPSLKKGPWSKEEDQLLRNAVAKYGTKEWGKIRLEVPGRTDGACRDRYLDCLQENVKKGPWSKEEVELLKEKVEKYGVGKWSKIASEIPNRIDCQCLHKWKLLTQASTSKEHQSKGIKRKRRPTTVPGKRKRQKVLKKNIKQEMITSSEDENQINNMDSDVESDVPKDLEIPQNREIPRKDYVQPDMKEWIPVNANTVVHSLGTVRTVWVCPPTIEDELEESTKKSVFGRIRSQKSKCPKVMLSFVRNTVLNRFGNVERTYVGLKPTVLQSQTDDEKAMLKVSLSDIKHFLQWKGASVIKKEKMTSPINIKKRRPVQDMASLNNDLLKAITPWIGNVILPAPANEDAFCKGDIVGMKAADITLPKTSVFSFFLKAFQIDVKGCKNVFEIQQKIDIKKPIAQSKPRTVSAMLKEAKQKAEHKKPAEPPQHPPPLQPVLLNIPQQPVMQMTTPALIHPKTLVITQPNKQRAVQPLMLTKQKISLLPQSPPQAISQIPLPLIQQTAPAQPVMASTPKSPSVEDSNSDRSTKRIHKPTEKVPALMEEAKAKGSKKKSLKRNQGKQNVVFQTITLQTQPVNWILAPTKLVQVTGPLSANIPSNQTLTVPNISPLNSSIHPCISTNLYPSSSALVVAASSVNPALICSSVTNASRDTLKTSSSVNISPKGIHMPLSPTSTLVQSKSVLHSVQMLSPAPKEDQKGSHIEAMKNSSDSSSDESIVKQYQTSTSTGSRVSPAVFSVLPVPLTVAPFASAPVASKPTNNVAVAKSPGVNENGCVPVRTIQLPTIIQQKSLPDTILSPLSTSRRPLRPIAPSPQFIAQYPNIVAPLAQIVALSPQIVAPSPRIVAPPTQIVATSPRIVAAPTQIVAPSPRIVAPPTQIVAPSPRIVAPSPRIVAPSPQFVAPTTRIVAPSPWIVAPPPQIVASSPQIAAPPPQIVAPSEVPQIITSSEPLIPLPDIPSDVVSFNPHLIFPEQSSEVDDWMNGKGGIPLPHLEMSLPYLPPSAASIETLTSLLKVKQSLLAAAVNILPDEYQNYREEEDQVAAIRKMIAERFASNPAYLLLKARFLSCFTLPALLATINPSEKCQLPTDNNGDDAEVLYLQKRKKRIQPPATRAELNTNENEASANHFSGIRTKRKGVDVELHKVHQLNECQ
ncbi:snRNA-activating protein complex subunit 4-like [Sinocyclocheilus rhinocerous]|uniref:snRNA-activating protein complex subunit 4-like n=1 Tax=Sinocyclocheilus rhinocerous TaxID=307959 RepID=UPI0007BA9227|nr:PREDICTED: snRNA-activating protein complex subunit 4-like [Sinocyclocheilus rhinocerous]